MVKLPKKSEEGLTLDCNKLGPNSSRENLTLYTDKDMSKAGLILDKETGVVYAPNGIIGQKFYDKNGKLLIDENGIWKGDLQVFNQSIEAHINESASNGSISQKIKEGIGTISGNVSSNTTSINTINEKLSKIADPIKTIFVEHDYSDYIYCSRKDHDNDHIQINSCSMMIECKRMDGKEIIDISMQGLFSVTYNVPVAFNINLFKFGYQHCNLFLATFSQFGFGQERGYDIVTGSPHYEDKFRIEFDSIRTRNFSISCKIVLNMK